MPLPTAPRSGGCSLPDEWRSVWSHLAPSAWRRVSCSGMLVGLAGALTIKSVFFCAMFRRHRLFCSGVTRPTPCQVVLNRSGGADCCGLRFSFCPCGWVTWFLALPAAASQGRQFGVAKMHSFLRFFEFEQVCVSSLPEMALAPLRTLASFCFSPVATRIALQW